MINVQSIKEKMEVLGSDGQHVGVVDHLDGTDKIKLTKSDPKSGGQHHIIPLAWVDQGGRPCPPQQEHQGRHDAVAGGGVRSTASCCRARPGQSPTRARPNTASITSGGRPRSTSA